MRLFLEWLLMLWGLVWTKKSVADSTTGIPPDKVENVVLFKPVDGVWQQGLPSKEKRIKNRNKRKVRGE